MKIDIFRRPPCLSRFNNSIPLETALGARLSKTPSPGYARRPRWMTPKVFLALLTFFVAAKYIQFNGLTILETRSFGFDEVMR